MQPLLQLWSDVHLGEMTISSPPCTVAAHLDTLLACWQCKPCATWQLCVQLLARL